MIWNTFWVYLIILTYRNRKSNSNADLPILSLNDTKESLNYMDNTPNLQDPIIHKKAILNNTLSDSNILPIPEKFSAKKARLRVRNSLHFLLKLFRDIWERMMSKDQRNI